jgi:hypothetical protein
MTSQIVNVAIVLIAIFIALGLACSWLQEQVAAIAKLRANTLVEGIKELISQDAGVLNQLKTHPLVAAVSANAKSNLPSYIDARNFTLAFWQSVGPTVDAVATTPLGHAIADPKVALTSVIDAVNAWSPNLESAKNVKRSAVALLNSAEGDYDKLLKATDAWFNAKMDRVSGWYKRKAQYFLIGIALVISFGAGIDTIDIGRQLFAAPAISEATAQSISAVVQKHSGDSDPSSGIQAVGKAIAGAQGLQNLRLVRPSWWFWWSAQPASTGTVPTPGILESVFGMLITTIAASLGAPFWFDILKGVVNVRMAGEKPDDSPPPVAPASAT